MRGPDEAGLTLVYLVRHGATQWNESGRWAGRSDMPLSDLGRLQAERLAERLAADPGAFARAFTSGLMRADETARIVAARLGVPVEVDARLLEMAYGEWEGKTPEEIRRTPEGAALLARWVARPATIAAPGGEAPLDVLDRALEWIRETGARFPGGRLLAAGHRSTNRILIAHARGIPLDDYRRAVPQDNGALNVLAVDPRGTVTALVVNDTAHLDGLPRPEGRQA